MEYFVGEIIPFAGPYAPQDTLECAGQTLSISDYNVLYSLIGTTYGGDGTTTFALPDLRGVVPIGIDNAATPLGWKGGTGEVTLSTAQIPAHNHLVMGSQSQATSTVITGGSVLASTAPNILPYGDLTKPVANTRNLSPKALGASGGSQPHANVMPTGALRYAICVNGYYPQFQ